MEEKEIASANQSLHFIKLIVSDILIIWIISATWMKFGVGTASFLLPHLYALILVTLIWIISTFPFLIRYQVMKKKEVTEFTRLRNYKLILQINTIILILILTLIIITPM